QELDTLGFECTLEEVDPEDITKNQINTIKACTAEDPGVKYINNSHISCSFCPSQSKCLQGIYEDLRAYRTELNSFKDHKVLATLDEMMKVSI
ncbi:IL12A protein, partial [Cephalopterus ornatus]|nr:IL12A protein [Cephalopterus ornatus]